MAGIRLGGLADLLGEDPGPLAGLAAAFPEPLDAGGPGRTVAQAAPPPTSLTPEQWAAVAHVPLSATSPARALGFAAARGATAAGPAIRDHLDELLHHLTAHFAAEAGERALARAGSFPSAGVPLLLGGPR